MVFGSLVSAKNVYSVIGTDSMVLGNVASGAAAGASSAVFVYSLD